jgi:hypothetical protein
VGMIATLLSGLCETDHLQGVLAFDVQVGVLICWFFSSIEVVWSLRWRKTVGHTHFLASVTASIFDAPGHALPNRGAGESREAG